MRTTLTLDYLNNSGSHYIDYVQSPDNAYKTKKIYKGIQCNKNMVSITNLKSKSNLSP